MQALQCLVAIMATIDTVKEVLENLDISPETVSDDSTFDSLPGIDSWTWSS